MQLRFYSVGGDVFKVYAAVAAAHPRNAVAHFAADCDGKGTARRYLAHIDYVENNGATSAAATNADGAHNGSDGGDTADGDVVVVGGGNNDAMRWQYHTEVGTGLCEMRWQYHTEVGTGLCEIVAGPAVDAIALEATMAKATTVLAAAAAPLGLHLLGAGIRPATAASAAPRTQRAKYIASEAAVGEP
jgi:hypothetical protein